MIENQLNFVPASFRPAAQSSDMANQTNPKPGLITQTLDKAAVFWRRLIGLMVFIRDQAKAFVEWAADEKPGAVRKPWFNKAQWDVIAVFAAQLPLYGLKLLILTGLVINQCRSEVSGTLTADPLDGAALVSADLPQIGAYFYIAALWLFLEFVVILVKIIKPRIDVQVS